MNLHGLGVVGVIRKKSYVLLSFQIYPIYLLQHNYFKKFTYLLSTIWSQITKASLSYPSEKVSFITSTYHEKNTLTPYPCGVALR
jgi:hypothetical protein